MRRGHNRRGESCFKQCRFGTAISLLHNCVETSSAKEKLHQDWWWVWLRREWSRKEEKLPNLRSKQANYHSQKQTPQNTRHVFHCQHFTGSGGQFPAIAESHMFWKVFSSGMVFTAVFLQSGLLARAIRSRTIRSREAFFLAWNAWSKEFAGNAIESKARVSSQCKW